jgi:hypothetical protein
MDCALNSIHASCFISFGCSWFVIYYIYIILIYFNFLNKDGVPKGMLEVFIKRYD